MKRSRCSAITESERDGHGNRLSAIQQKCLPSEMEKTNLNVVSENRTNRLKPQQTHLTGPTTPLRSLITRSLLWCPALVKPKSYTFTWAAILCKQCPVSDALKAKDTLNAFIKNNKGIQIYTRWDRRRRNDGKSCWY